MKITFKKGLLAAIAAQYPGARAHPLAAPDALQAQQR